MKRLIEKQCTTTFTDDCSDTTPLLNPFPHNPCFLRVCSTSLLKTLWEKEKLLITGNFSFSHSVFNLLEELFSIVIKFEIVVCKLFSFWKHVIFVVWERVNPLPHKTAF